MPFVIQNLLLQYWSIIILSSIDFWMIKNVCGRFLLGYRWWVEFDENDEESWVFESKPQIKRNKIEERYFWLSQYIFILILVGLSVESIVRI